MRITKRRIARENRNNASSVSCYNSYFINLSRNNNSNVVWRKWNNKDGTEGKR